MDAKGDTKKKSYGGQKRPATGQSPFQRVSAMERKKARRTITTQSDAEERAGKKIGASNISTIPAIKKQPRGQYGNGSKSEASPAGTGKDKKSGKHAKQGQDNSSKSQSNSTDTPKPTSSNVNNNSTKGANGSTNPSTTTVTHSETAMDTLVLRTIRVEDFAQARAFEIASMQAALRKDSEHAGQLRVFQTVPRHMRRRAASHNVKRLPKRMRMRALAQVERDSGNPQQRPKMSRKHVMTTLSRRKRRRLGVILQRLAAREAQKISGITDDVEAESTATKWLETHLWHTKRAKMIKLWGYKVALKPNDKSYKSAFRSTKLTSLLSDTSYESVFELEGTEEGITNILTRITDPTMPQISSKKFIRGDIQGSQYLYGVHKYPTAMIGPMKFLWRQDNTKQDTTKKGKPAKNQSTTRKIWLWVHPSIRIAVSNLLLESSIEEEKGHDVVITDLSNEIDSFTLKGPRTHAILEYILHLAGKIDGDSDNTIINDYSHHTWSKLLKKLRTPGTLRPGCVLSLTIDDPRLHLVGQHKMPSREIEHDTTKEELKAIEQLSENWCDLPKDKVNNLYKDVIKEEDSKMEYLPLATSKIWNPEVRKHIVYNRMPDSEIHKRRQSIPVLGDDLIPSYKGSESNDPRIPILLIRSLDHGTSTSYTQATPGWTIVYPCGYGKDLWLNLIFSGGCRLGGLRELRNHSFELGNPCFPYDYPETDAFEKIEFRNGGEEWARWLRTPKGKRDEYPHDARNVFIRDFKSLADELSTVDEVEYETSCKELVQQVREVFKIEPANGKHQEDIQKTLPQALTASTSDTRGFVGVTSPLILRHIASIIEKSLVSEPLGTGVQASLNDEIIYEYISALIKRGRGERYLQTLDISKTENERLPLFVHVAVSFRKGGRPSDLDVIYAPPVTQKLISKIRDQEDEMADDITEQIEVEVDQSSILPIGYITSGDISYSRGFGFAIGMCPLESLAKLAWFKIPMKGSHHQLGPFNVAAKVLTKSPNGVKYNWTDITILEPIPN